MNRILAIACLFAITPLLLAETTIEGNTAAAIIEKHNQAKAAALETYLSTTPSDAADAEEELLGTYVELRQFDKAEKILTKRLAALPKGAELPPMPYFQTLMPLVEMLLESGKKTEARALVKQAGIDVTGHELESQMREALAELEAKFLRPAVGEKVEFSCTTQDGKKFDLSELKGKVVLLDFWATWCGPCVAELPSVKAAYQEFHGQGFEVLGISLDEDAATLAAFLKQNEIPWAQEFTGKGWQNSLAQAWGIQSIPATFLIGKDGVLVAADLRGAALSEAVKKALAAK